MLNLQFSINNRCFNDISFENLPVENSMKIEKIEIENFIV